MFAVAFLPQFALQSVLRHEPELWLKPVALTDPAERPPVIYDMTKPAAAVGVTKGLTPTQAMARCASILLRPRSARQENAATHALLQCAYAFSPHLESTAPGMCTLDLRGLATLWITERGALENWALKLKASLAGAHLTSRIGIAPTPNVARHAAQWGKEIEIVEDPAPFIAGLPVAALDPSPEVSLILNRWGVKTAGEFLALGQNALIARLGLETLALFAASSSTAIRPLHLARPTERFEESFEFETVVETLEPLLFLLRRFIDQLSHRLQWRGLAAEVLVLQITLESGQKLMSRLRLPQPTREPDVLFRTLQTHLETVKTESAIKVVGLTMLPVEEAQKQLGLFETVLADPLQFRETLARLAAVLGADQVGTPALENSHRPDAFQLLPPDFEKEFCTIREDQGIQLSLAPLRRFRPPIKAEVHCERREPPNTNQEKKFQLQEQSKPLSIQCSLIKGKLKVVLGPWRGSGNWWEPTGWEREEWDAMTSDGKVIRLVHQNQGWFVEGVMD